MRSLIYVGSKKKEGDWLSPSVLTKSIIDKSDLVVITS